MQTPIIDKEERVFREPSIFAADLKSINLDNVLVSLFMLIRNNGERVKLKLKAGKMHTVASLVEYFNVLEQQGAAEGFADHADATVSWLRSNLVNMVFRGKAKENVASLRPLHLESYRIRNQKHTRDYNTADQVYIMLNHQPQVRDALRDYLNIGWDKRSNCIVDNPTLDVDTAGLLHLIKLIGVVPQKSSTLESIKPLLENQADLYCDDVRRLLAYQHSIPRSVFIEYLRIITGLHLSLYLMKLIHLLPKMVEKGSRDVHDDWSLVVDVTEKLDGNMSAIACDDMSRLLGGTLAYINSTFKVRTIRRLLGNDTDIETILANIKNPTDETNAELRILLRKVKENYHRGSDSEEEALENINELENYLQYEDGDLNRYVECLMKVGAAYQLKYSREFLDRASMKNTDSALMIDGKSKKHPRRGALGSKLLEVLVQLLVLQPTATGEFDSKPLSISELIRSIRQRYGLIIDGSSEARFQATDIKTNLAFKENVEALKSKLRQIGFFTDLSDASALQKIRPRYKFNS